MKFLWCCEGGVDHLLYVQCALIPFYSGKILHLWEFNSFFLLRSAIFLAGGSLGKILILLASSGLLLRHVSMGRFVWQHLAYDSLFNLSDEDALKNYPKQNDERKHESYGSSHTPLG